MIAFAMNNTYITVIPYSLEFTLSDSWDKAKKIDLIILHEI